MALFSPVQATIVPHNSDVFHTIAAAATHIRSVFVCSRPIRPLAYEADAPANRMNSHDVVALSVGQQPID